MAKAITPLNYDTELYGGDEYLGMRDYDPETYNANVIGAINNVRLGNVWNNQSGQNKEVDEYLKKITTEAGRPDLYKAAEVQFLAANAGRYAGMGENNSDWQKQLNEAIPEALKSGVSQSSISSMIDSSYQKGAKDAQVKLSHEWNDTGIINQYGWAVPLLLAAGGAAAGGAFAGEGAGLAGGGLTAEGGTAGGFGLNAASPSGIMATQSAAGLGGAGTGIIEGLVPSSVGMGGTYGAGSLAGIAGTEAAAGLGGAALGTGLTAEQLAAYEAANPGMSTKDILSNVNRARQLAKLVSPTTGKQSAQQFAQLQQANQPAMEQFGGYYQMNKNPFAQTQQAASITNPLAKTQDFLAQLAQEGKPTPTLADLVRTA